MDILKHFKVVSTIKQEDDETAWKHARRRGLGGSDIGAICGVNPYTSARHIYLQKTEQYESDFGGAAQERMLFGHLLEPVVANEYSRRTGKKLAVANATICHKEHNWALANVDRIIVDDDGNPIGILECKTAGEYMKDDWDEGDLPVSYIYQLQWYLFVTGLKYGAFACLVGGNKFFYYDIVRDDNLIEVLFAKADRFWNYNVRQLIAPELDGSDACEEFIAKEVKKGTEIILEEDTYDELAATIVSAKAEIKALENIVEAAQYRLKEKIGTNEIAYTSSYVIKWPERTQSRIDSALLKLNYPEAAKACSKTISFRVFQIKGGK